MPTPSSPSRAEALLREAIELEAEEIYLQAEGERAKMRYRVSGRIVQKLKGYLPEAQDVFDELKALATQGVVEGEDEWLGYLSFSVEERSKWIRVYWFRDQEADGAEGVVVSILERWLSFGELGLSARDGATLGELISLPEGVIVGCGMTGSGHTTTLNALLERLEQNGKRVVSLAEQSDPRLQGVTQIDAQSEEMSDQIELLAGHFDVFALGHLDSPSKVRAAFDLAREGHLVLGLTYNFPVYTAMSRFLQEGISREEVHSYFLGGWSQRLVQRADNNGSIGLFSCVGREETRSQFLALQDADYQALDEQEEEALWRDAEEKIAAGLVTREQVVRILQQL